MAITTEYLNLIPSQHRARKKYIHTLTALMKPLDDIFSLLVYFDDYFDLDQATGPQQDILGDIAGQGRMLSFDPHSGESSILDNIAYRNLIKAKILQNHWKGGIDELKEGWKTLYTGGDILITDHQNMSIDIHVVGAFDEVTKNLISEGMVVPKPVSVGTNFYFSDNAVFAYDRDTATMKGYDLGYWEYQYPQDLYAYDTEDDVKRLKGYDEGYWG